MQEGRFEKFKKELDELEKAKTVEDVYGSDDERLRKAGIKVPKSLKTKREKQLAETKALQRNLGIKEMEQEAAGLRKGGGALPEQKISDHFLERLRRLEENEGIEGVQEKFKTALTAIRESGQRLLEKQPSIRKGKIERTSSGKVDRTEGDMEADDIILSAIRRKYPDAVIISEESHPHLTPEEKRAEGKWYVDPLDGTRSYSSNRVHFATMLAYESGENLQFSIVYLPARGELYYAARGAGAFLNDRQIHVDNDLRLKDGFLELNQSLRGQRHLFDEHKLQPPRFSRVVPVECEGAALAAIARGTTAAHVGVQAHEWDVAPGILLIREAGGEVTNDDGEPFDMEQDCPRAIIASNGAEHKKLLKILEDALA